MIRSYQRVLAKCMMPAKTKNGPKNLPMQGNLSEGRLRLGDAEAFLVQRPADDHAAEVAETQLGEGTEMVERSHAARVDQLAVRRVRHSTQRVKVGSLHQAVDVNRRVDEAPDATPG